MTTLTCGTPRARTSAAIATIASYTGISPDEVRGYLAECIAVANRAIAAGADVDLVGDFIDRVAPPTSCGRNSSAARFPAARLQNRVSRPWLAGRAPTTGGGLWVQYPTASRNTPGSHRVADDDSVKSLAEVLPVEELVAIIRASVIRGTELGPLPVRRR